MCWRAIVLARPLTHTSIYLARCAIVAHSKLYMMNLYDEKFVYSSPSVLIINSLIMFFHKRSIRAILQWPGLLVSVYCPLGNLTKINDLNIFVELKINSHTV